VTQFSTLSLKLQRSLQAALAAVAGERVVAARLRSLPHFRAGTEPVWTVALGKAAPAMLRGAAEVLGAQIQAALVVTRADCWAATEADFPFPVETHFGGHPQINAASFVAGEALIRFLDQVPERVPGRGRLLFLISGGASALVELPRPGVTLEDFQRLTEEAFAAGWGIAQLNAIRARFSQIKGGGLWRFCQGRDVTELLISDVPKDDPQVIASGLLHPIVDKKKDSQHIDYHLPEWIRKVLIKTSQPDVFKVEVQEKFRSFVIASNAMLRAALMVRLQAELPQFLPAPATNSVLEIQDGGLLPDRLEAALACVEDEVRTASSRKEIRVKVWGGEVPIPLPEVAGCGGRARHFALVLAQRLAGVSGWQLLVAATDGSDGSDLQAGAVVDGATAERAASAGLSVEAALRAADSGSLLAQLGQDFATGPTGSNVMDVVVLLYWPAAAVGRAE
jgi:glycerate 2-kinase